MNSRLYSILILFFISYGTIQGQIIISADSVFTQVIEDVEVVGHNTFTNAIPQQKTFAWLKNDVVMPEPWTAAICDNAQCYTPFVDSMTITLGPSASSILDVHLSLKDVFEGYALVEMTVKDISNPQSTVSAVYTFDDSPLSSVKEQKVLFFNVYPNPGNGIFHIKNKDAKVSFVQVYNLQGQILKDIDLYNREFIDLAELEKGSYVIRLLGKDRGWLGSKMISKL